MLTPTHRDQGAGKVGSLIELLVRRQVAGHESDPASLWPELEREQRVELVALVDRERGRRWLRKERPAARFACHVADLAEQAGPPP